MQTIKAQNSIITGSVSMIMAICSNGAWICLVINETIGSFKFTWFIKILIRWLKSNSYFRYFQIMILLENSSIRKSKTVKSLLKKTNFTIIYIHVYRTDFASVEMCFSLIKRAL